MDFLSQFLPIIIYVLLIVVIVIGIVLGIKLIITLDKVTRLVDDVNEKVEKVKPLFNIVGTLSDGLTGMIGTVVATTEKLLDRLFLKNKNREKMESEEDE